MTTTLYTVGYSNHTLEHFLALLRANSITAIADVRSSPYGGYSPHFNREPLSAALQECGIAYVWLGAELGARPADPTCYDQSGRVVYRKLGSSPAFSSGLNRVVQGAQKYRLALMCAEAEPLRCHRSVLIGRALELRGVDLQHIRPDGSVETHETVMSRLLEQAGCDEADMFRSREELVDYACACLEHEIAFRRQETTS